MSCSHIKYDQTLNKDDDKVPTYTTKNLFKVWILSLMGDILLINVHYFNHVQMLFISF
jgi:hypothetical protein